MPQPTVIRVAIEPGESLYGFMTRVAIANGYDHPNWLLDGHATCRSLDTGTWTDAAVAQIAAITASDPSEIERRVYRGLGGDRRLFFGHDLPSSLLVPGAQKSRRRFCPRCLETGVHHAIFDLALITACPIHECRTTDRCPRCGKPVLWRGTVLFHCWDCGIDLRRTTTEDVGRAALSGIKAIMDVAGIAHGNRKPEAVLPAPLSHLRFCDALELMLGLVSFLGSRPSETSFLEFSDAARERLHVDLAEGWDIIRDWPAGLPDFLHRYQTRLGTVGTIFGAEPAFGRFYTHVRQATREPWITVRDAFVAFLETGWEGNAIPRPDKSTKAPPIDFKTNSVSIAEAARMLGRSTAKVKHLIELGILKGTRAGAFWGAPVFVTRASIDVIAPAGERPIRLDELGAMLGLSRQRSRQLVDEGALTPVLGPDIDGSKIYLFRRKDAAALMADIARHLEVPVRMPRTKSFADVLKGARARRIGIKPIIEAMRNGRLAPIGVEDLERGLNAYRFGYEAARAVLTDLEAELGGGNDKLSLAMVGRRLGIPSHTVGDLVASGFLEQVAEAGAAKVPNHSLLSFEERYVLTSQAARSCGMTARWFRHSMLERGVTPVECQGRGRSTSFFPREHLPVDLRRA